MDPPPQAKLNRSNSISQASENSQTAQEFINSQLELEAEAREALPYQFDQCTRHLGSIRQLLFSCLTCNPPPSDPNASYNPAGVCYSCSISCHGEHELVELFNKRDFTCDCGTTRFSATQPCTLRLSESTGEKGDVHSENSEANNNYNQNFRNRFCGCGAEYNAHKESGTMFQCLGLGTVEEGGCGEDWYHPECLMGISRDWREIKKQEADALKNSLTEAVPQEIKEGGDATKAASVNGNGDTVMQESLPVGGPVREEEEDVFDDDNPQGFPHEDSFEYLLCYKCVQAFPWIKNYASRPGFLSPLFYGKSKPVEEDATAGSEIVSDTESRKRKADDGDDSAIQPLKKQRNLDDTPHDAATSHTNGTTNGTNAESIITNDTSGSKCTYPTMSPPTEPLTLFLTADFRDHLCRCSTHYPLLAPHRQLLEEEDNYEPPLSSAGDEAPGSLGSRSLLERGEAALSNVDRVRAIEGVMVYNHLKDKVKSFLKPFADSGTAVGAEDIKKYFETLRGDAEGIQKAGESAEKGGKDGGGDGDGRKEQSGEWS
ncbi:hypothetical protein BT63DRAFT_385665 [Microthyrium microscopicum]|uniref:UBR-type domain-containing protein n=1 Tax=Microthyrium microscopicum TaxID=703497 RepID=A0A6A6UG60_9PEZI|nr:hypothetical protein BT63DRAFT_385665 [Microthyrium microscopicum]